MVAAGLDGDETLHLVHQPGGHWRHDVIRGESIEFACISNDALNLGHRLEGRRIELGRTAGHQNPGARAAAMRMTDRLPRLPHGLAGHGAAVDDDPVLVRGRRARDRLAFGEVEPATEGDRFDAHDKVSRSSSPLKTCVAVPRMRIGCPGSHAIVSEPPGIVTLTGDSARLLRIAATAVAQAPVPQARVRPAPRSHVFSRMPSPPTEARLTLTRSGNVGSCSIFGPSSSIGMEFTSSTKNTACGFPTLSAIGRDRPSQAIGRAAVSSA